MQMRFDTMFDEVKDVRTKIDSFDNFVNNTVNQNSPAPTESSSYVMNVIIGITGTEQKQWVCKSMLILFNNAEKNQKLSIRAAVNQLNLDISDAKIIYGILISFYHNGIFYDKKIKEKVEEENKKITLECKEEL